MRHLSRVWVVLWLVLSASVVGAGAQNLEGGVHVGYVNLDGELMPNRETGGEFGVWAMLWPADAWTISADWGRAHRPDWAGTLAGRPVGEVGRNRQFVDVTLQYHFLRRKRFSLYAEVGGGSHWNNRHVDNPYGVRGFEESGKESTRQRIVSFGGGIRYNLTSHLHWINSLKVHNPIREERNSIRFLTGLTLSFR